MSIASRSAAQPPWVRGAIDSNRSKETLQEGYLHAVVAAAGCTLGKPSPDNGVDWMITHEANGFHTCDSEAVMKVQLKATHTVAPRPTGSHFSFPLERPHFDRLAQSPVTITRLLVVMITPDKPEKWIRSTGNFLAIRHQCFWVNLEGVKSNGKGTQTVHVPTTNVFDDKALCDIMCRIGRGVTPR